MFNMLKKKKIKEKYSFVFYHRSGYHILLTHHCSENCELMEIIKSKE